MKNNNWHLNIEYMAFLLLSLCVSCSKPIYYKITAWAKDAEMGEVYGTGTYEANSEVLLTAEAKEGYVFAHWQDGNRENPRHIIVSSDYEYVAYFQLSDQDDPEENGYETGFVTDREGNQYKTLKVGDTWWMAEDLSANTLPNGTNIMEDAGAQVGDDDPVCFNVTISDVSHPCHLYNWAAANAVCPEGWRLPSKEEWSEMIHDVGSHGTWCFNGDPNNVSKALSAPNGWQLSEIPGTPGYHRNENNVSGMGLLPAGVVDQGVSSLQTCNGFYWTSSSLNSTVGYHYTVYYDKTSVTLNLNNKSRAHSVRCVK